MRVGDLTAIHGGPRAGIHIGKVTDPYGYGPGVSISLCGVGNNPILEIWWRATTATEVTCAQCYQIAKETMEGTT